MTKIDRKEPMGERRGHFRGRAGPGKRIDLIYWRCDGKPTASGNEKQKAVATNLGVGGAFLLSTPLEEAGTEIELTLAIPDADPLHLKATVRWQEEGNAQVPSGIGIRFASLDVQSLQILQRFFSQL